MKLQNKIRALTFLSAIAMSSAVVATTSSDIPLGVAHVAPGKTFNLPLDKLYAGVEYRLMCDIKYDVPPQKASYSQLQIFCSSANTKLQKDDFDLGVCGSSGRVLNFKTQGSKLNMEPVKASSNVQIQNLDYTDTISVDCVAKISY